MGIGCLGMIIFLIFLITGAKSDSSGIIWLGIIGIGVSAFYGLYLDNKRKENLLSSLRNNIEDTLKNIEEFNKTQGFVSEDRETAIYIDENRKKVCVIENKTENAVSLSTTLSKYSYEAKVYSYDDILQSEILSNGASVTKTSRTGQIGGAIVGGVLAGGVGAIIGGSGASQSTTEMVQTVQLQIVVNNSRKSFYRITFASFETSVSKDNLIYKEAEKKITHWHNLMSYILKHTDEENKENEIKLKQTNQEEYFPNNNSIADELIKLSDLLKQGLITQDEFNKQKDKILR